MKKTNDGLVVIEKEVNTLTSAAKKIVIKSAGDMKAATGMLSQLNKIADKITAEKEKVTKPLNEALKAERARWKPIESFYEDAIAHLRGEMSSYQTAETNRARAEEEAIANRVGEGKGKLKVETAVRKIGEVDRADKVVASADGVVKFREVQQLKIMDEMLIPREYLMLDEKKILADLKAGKQVFGAILEVVQVPVNFR